MARKRSSVRSRLAPPICYLKPKCSSSLIKHKDVVVPILLLATYPIIFYQKIGNKANMDYIYINNKILTLMVFGMHLFQNKQTQHKRNLI